MSSFDCNRDVVWSTDYNRGVTSSFDCNKFGTGLSSRPSKPTTTCAINFFYFVDRQRLSITCRSFVDRATSNLQEELIRKWQKTCFCCTIGSARRLYCYRLKLKFFCIKAHLLCCFVGGNPKIRSPCWVRIFFVKITYTATNCMQIQFSSLSRAQPTISSTGINNSFKQQERTFSTSAGWRKNMQIWQRNLE